MGQELKVMLQSCSGILLQLEFRKELSLTAKGQDFILCVKTVTGHQSLQTLSLLHRHQEESGGPQDIVSSGVYITDHL